MKSHVDTLEKVAGQKQKAACKGRVWASKERRETEKYRAGELLTAGVCCRLKSRGLQGKQIAKESGRKGKIKKKKIGVDKQEKIRPGGNFS